MQTQKMQELPPREGDAQPQVEEMLVTDAQPSQIHNQANSPLPSSQKLKCHLTEKQLK